MNYLAHFYLAGGSGESVLGTLLGDYVRGSNLETYPVTIRNAIRLHRCVDAFTDAHPVVLESKRRISLANRRYAGILVDIYYDHFLARDWEEYSPSPLPEFASRIYQALRGQVEMAPERLRRMVERMAEEDWLASYAEIAGVEAALGRVSRRLRRENGLAHAVSELLGNYDPLHADFRRFFSELASRAQRLRGSARPTRGDRIASRAHSSASDGDA